MRIQFIFAGVVIALAAGTLLSPGHQAHDPELLHDVGKRRTRMRA